MKIYIYILVLFLFFFAFVFPSIFSKLIYFKQSRTNKKSKENILKK